MNNTCIALLTTMTRLTAKPFNYRNYLIEGVLITSRQQVEINTYSIHITVALNRFIAVKRH
jgi:hypothetical protein